ncbi:hypothetical protein LTR09_008981 [Extremus antarcticus]|uniref:Uncharacterized protein n=1 Tax=Extremus antarcticus TaxID=702011 RepID=A0AAJ0DGN5_9PEZI|nr:hypothetical protein LTR09_008981 [Extremus antarcticus]
MAEEPNISSLGSLPAELREIIWDFCIPTTDVDLTTAPPLRPNEPPLTKVSKGIRAETLPMYYAQWPLTIRCIHNEGDGHTTTNPWYHSIRPEKLKHIKRLWVYFSQARLHTGRLVYEPLPHSWLITLKTRENSFEASAAPSYERGFWAVVIWRHLEEVLGGLLDNERIGKITAADLEQLAHFNPSLRRRREKGFKG